MPCSSMARISVASVWAGGLGEVFPVKVLQGQRFALPQGRFFFSSSLPSSYTAV